MEKEEKKKLHSGPPKYILPGHNSSKETAGQEESGRMRQPTTSAVVRHDR